MTRILGVDLGDRRIGLAIADRDGGRALPLTTLLRKPTVEEDAAAVAGIAADQQVDETVIGLPLHAAGDEGTQAIATREARRLRRERRPWADAFASLLLATVAHQHGDAAAASRSLTAAVTLFDSADMQLYAAVSRRCLGVLLGGSAGTQLQVDAATWMSAQEITDPAAMTRLIAPGFPEAAS